MVTKGSVAIAAGLIAISCSAESEPAVYDRTGLESGIGAALVPDRPGVVSGVSCPDVDLRADAEPPETTTLQCRAVIGETPVAVTVRVIGGRVDVSTDAFLVDVAMLEEQSAARLSKDLGPTTVDCDTDPVLVSVAGTTLACEASDARGVAHPISITIVSETGDWELGLG